MSDSISRRDFVADSGKLALGAMIVPRNVLGGVGYQAPSDTLNVAVVGVGGMGMQNMGALLDQNVVALCDVDFGYVERSLANRLRPNQQGEVSERARQLQAAYVKAHKFADYREMLEKQKDIDAVVIATPDHMHAAIANMAMKLGKHVYVQKPLAYSVHECRVLAQTARETGVATQMGNQGHSMEGTQRVVELIAGGLIGPVREVHVWTDRPVRYWAQGIPRPPAQQVAQAGQAVPGVVPAQWNVRTVENAVLRAMGDVAQGPPGTLNWDLYLGVAKEVPYHPAYHPFSWRGWVDFGVGAIGDMGAHLMDQSYKALNLGYPTSITASSTAWGGGAQNPASYPLAMMVQYEFPARGNQPPVKMYWYDSGLLPPRPDALPADVPFPSGDGGGAILIGSKGILSHETYGRNPQIFPTTLERDAERIPRRLPRYDVSHESNWVQACKGQAQAAAPFDYSARLTEVMLLGIAALRAGQGRKVLYDGANMRFTNAPEANQYLTREYREGWDL